MTWLISKALIQAYENSHCSQEQAVASSAANSLDGVPCAPLNVMPTPHPFWHRDKMTDFSKRSPSGLTCAVLTADRGADLLMWFREDSLAKTSPPPEKGLASKEAEADCGEKWHALSVKFDPDSCGWKTHHCLFQEDLDWSSLTLPAWGMMQDGDLWERTTQALPTAANGSGSGENWQTPLSTDATHGGPNQRDSSGRPGLTACAIAGGTSTRQMYHTPRATDTGRGENPETFVKRNGDRTESCSGSLAAQVCRMWPTPRAGNPGNRKPGTGGKVLGEEAKKWATPRCFMHKDSQTDRGKSNLGEQVGGQLNPDWVEWLMGWPIGWTCPAPLSLDRFQEWQAASGIGWTDSAPLETDSAPPQCGLHGSP